MTIVPLRSGEEFQVDPSIMTPCLSPACWMIPGVQSANKMIYISPNKLIGTFSDSLGTFLELKNKRELTAWFSVSSSMDLVDGTTIVTCWVPLRREASSLASKSLLGALETSSAARSALCLTAEVRIRW